jgi:hypothetical protein
MTWTLDGGEPEVTDRDSDPSPEVLTPEVSAANSSASPEKPEHFPRHLRHCGRLLHGHPANFAESQLFDS